MKDKNYTLKSKEEEEGKVFFIFEGSFKQLVIVAYSKNKELFLVKSNLLALNLVFAQMEMKNKEFKILSSVNEEFEGNKWVDIIWAKKGYKYQFQIEDNGEKISWVYLLSADAQIEYNQDSKSVAP
ncbi:hypothetical protein LK994_12875 [Ferruginibacter lapsinanis]|uniref:hypothetical protein n=1 Tax=Ferruginibacter lapsinanis TaxID=563172 RepID=UPI001E3A5423|nr:hypothetical protein [Ferruginibacter lapsinanis]UEG49527.1 hypothetical protein LK994_12875 [Ferruginibacter lapsinanis]